MVPLERLRLTDTTIAVYANDFNRIYAENLGHFAGSIPTKFPLRHDNHLSVAVVYTDGHGAAVPVHNVPRTIWMSDADDERVRQILESDSYFGTRTTSAIGGLGRVNPKAR